MWRYALWMHTTATSEHAHACTAQRQTRTTDRWFLQVITPAGRHQHVTLELCVHVTFTRTVSTVEIHRTAAWDKETTLHHICLTCTCTVHWWTSVNLPYSTAWSYVFFSLRIATTAFCYQTLVNTTRSTKFRILFPVCTHSIILLTRKWHCFDRQWRRRRLLPRGRLSESLPACTCPDRCSTSTESLKQTARASSTAWHQQLHVPPNVNL